MMADCTCNIANGLVSPGVVHVKQLANETMTLRWVMSSRFTKDNIDLSEYEPFLVLQRGDNGEIDQSKLIMDYDAQTITLTWNVSEWATKVAGYIKYQIVFRGRANKSELCILGAANLAPETGCYAQDNEGITDGFYRAWSHTNKYRDYKVNYDARNSRWQLVKGNELIAYQTTPADEPFDGIWDKVLVGCTGARVWNSGEAILNISESVAADQDISAKYPTILRQMWVNFHDMVIKSGFTVFEGEVEASDWKGSAAPYYVDCGRVADVPDGCTVTGVRLFKMLENGGCSDIANIRYEQSEDGSVYVYCLEKIAGKLAVTVKGGDDYVFVPESVLDTNVVQHTTSELEGI